MKRYIANTLGEYRIMPVEIIKETKSSYWTEGRSGPNRKENSYEKMFDTFEEAKHYLLVVCSREVAYLKKQTQDKNSLLGQITKLTEK